MVVQRPFGLSAEGVASNAPPKQLGEAELFSGGCYDGALQRCHAHGSGRSGSTELAEVLALPAGVVKGGYP